MIRRHFLPSLYTFILRPVVVNPLNFFLLYFLGLLSSTRLWPKAGDGGGGLKCGPCDQLLSTGEGAPRMLALWLGTPGFPFQRRPPSGFGEMIRVSDP